MLQVLISLAFKSHEASVRLVVTLCIVEKTQLTKFKEFTFEREIIRLKLFRNIFRIGEKFYQIWLTSNNQFHIINICYMSLNFYKDRMPFIFNFKSSCLLVCYFNTTGVYLCGCFPYIEGLKKSKNNDLGEL